MSVTVASTTDSEEDVKVAAGLPVEGDEPEEVATSEGDETPAEAESEPVEPADDKSKSAAASEAAEEEEEAEPEPKEPKASSKVQKRIDKLTEEKYELRDQNRELKERLDRLEALVQKAEPVKAQPEDAKPTRAQFKTDDEYFESLGRWSARDEARKNQQAESQRASNEELAVIFGNYNEATRVFKAENPDFDEVLGDTNLMIPIAVQNAIISYEQDGPALAYYLAKNPETANRLRGMLDTRAVAELGKIHAKLFPETEEAEEAQAEERKPVAVKPPAKKPVKAAAAPIRPNRAAGTNSTVNLEELPYADYRRVRDQQERGRIRR
jgi:hypothetical protein